MKNQRGFGTIALALAILFMILIFMGSAGVYFGSLYNEIARQQRIIASHAVTEDLALVVSRARFLFLSGPCPATTVSEAAYGLCWPLPGPSQTNHCVPHPLGSPVGAPRLICRAGFAAPPAMASSYELAFFLREKEHENLYAYLKDRYHQLKSQVSIGLDIVAANIQNAVEAQNSSDFSYLPTDLSSSGTVNFSAGLNCSASPDANYCKNCLGGAAPALLDRCVRIRVCLRPDASCTQNHHWVLRTIGVIGR